MIGMRELLSSLFFFFFSSRRRYTRFDCDWSSCVCSSDLGNRWGPGPGRRLSGHGGSWCVQRYLRADPDPAPEAAAGVEVAAVDGDAFFEADQAAAGAEGADRKSVVEGKSVDLGGRRIIKK